MRDHVITAAGLLLGAAAVGIPMGIYAARRYRGIEPVDTTSPQTVATSTSNVKGAKR